MKIADNVGYSAFMPNKTEYIQGCILHAAIEGGQIDIDSPEKVLLERIKNVILTADLFMKISERTLDLAAENARGKLVYLISKKQTSKKEAAKPTKCQIGDTMDVSNVIRCKNGSYTFSGKVNGVMKSFNTNDWEWKFV